MTDRSDKFTWTPDQIQVLNPDGTPKENTSQTVEKPEMGGEDRASRFQWQPEDVEILNPDGSKKK